MEFQWIEGDRYGGSRVRHSSIISLNVELRGSFGGMLGASGGVQSFRSELYTGVSIARVIRGISGLNTQPIVDSSGCCIHDADTSDGSNAYFGQRGRAQILVNCVARLGQIWRPTRVLLNC